MRRIVIILGLALSLAMLGAVAPASARAAWGAPNGCGPGGWVNQILGASPYNSRFTPACDRHDWCYGGAAAPVSAGALGDWLYRATCDRLFHERMLATCDSEPGCVLAADDYYAAVRAFGDSSLFGRPYTSGQRDGQRNLLPNPSHTGCRGCLPGAAAPTLHIGVRGSNTTYWKLNGGPWHRVGCAAWDPAHVECTADVTLALTLHGAQVVRVKAIDELTGPNGKTWPAVTWTY